MFHSDEEMSFEQHFKFYESWIKGLNVENDNYFTRQAENAHALAVWGGSQDLISETLNLAGATKNENARYYLQFGLGRRSMAIWTAFRGVYQLIPPDRDVPLTMDQVGLASNDLNAIYINIRGAMDNFAWCLQHLLVNEPIFKLKESQIGLFHPTFLKQSGMEKIKPLLEPFEQWSKDFKGRRDPAAHRVPLSIIPAIHDSTTLAQFQDIEQEISGLTNSAHQWIKKKDFQHSQLIFGEIEALRVKQQSLGKFFPFFEFDPTKSPATLYPTLPTDVGKYVLIARTLTKFLNGYHS